MRLQLNKKRHGACGMTACRCQTFRTSTFPTSRCCRKPTQTRNMRKMWFSRMKLVHCDWVGPRMSSLSIIELRTPRFCKGMMRNHEKPRRCIGGVVSDFEIITCAGDFDYFRLNCHGRQTPFIHSNQLYRLAKRLALPVQFGMLSFC